MFLRHLKLDVYEIRVAHDDVTWLNHVKQVQNDGALKCVIS
jgi:hypothetical protein